MAKRVLTGVEKKASSNGKPDQDSSRARILQTDVPAHTVEEALRVARAIGDNYAFQPSRPLEVAAAMSLSPNSSLFKMLCGAAIAYGLTEGGYNAALISVQPLARRILEPQEEGADLAARREAVLRPRVLREFLTKYDGNRLPKDQQIVLNVLGAMGLAKDARPRALEMITANAQAVGFLTDIKGSLYVNLRGTAPKPVTAGDEDGNDAASQQPNPGGGNPHETLPPSPGPCATSSARSENRRVFITHGKNRAFIEPLKDLLGFGELEPVVSVEKESVSMPVPEKVMADMRGCSAAIIHVDAELELIDNEGEKHIILNPNVMMEIGAAMALYGRRFILLVRDGVKLPSNLQGLYEVRYQGDRLDGDATIRLLKAIKDIKNHPLPAFAGLGNSSS